MDTSPPEPKYIPKYDPKPNDRIFVLREKPSKLHGHYVGPYIVQRKLTDSSLLVLNPDTRSTIKTSIQLIKPCHSTLPDPILNQYAAADAGELFIDALLDIAEDIATVLWSDGTTTQQPVDTVKNTNAYQRYIKLNEETPLKKRGRKKKGSVSLSR
ncbi:hypothetical protein RCL1_004033 [Eukaryota sp. TZLM3-RCL]